jgi:hypothetical protein
LLRNRIMRFPRESLTVFIIMAGIGCGGNATRDAALRKADLARAAGDLPAEALALREACGAAPDDKDVCRRAEVAQGNALAAIRVAARSNCELARTTPGNLPSCFASLSQARQLTRTDPEVEAIASIAGQAQSNYCNAFITSQPMQLTQGIRAFRCALSAQAVIATSSYQQWVEQTRTAVSAAFLQATSEAGIAGQQGASALLLSAAACVGNTPALQQRGQQALASYADAIRPAIVLNTQGPIAAQELCAVAIDKLGGPSGRASCRNSSKTAPQLAYGFALEVGQVTKQVSEQGMQKDYVARIDRRENPAYAVAARDEVFTREQLRQAEQQKSRDSATCDSASSALSRANSCYSCAERTERDRACNVADSSKRSADQRQQDADNASRRVRETEPIIEEKIWATATWVVRTHQWTAPWRSELTSKTGASTKWQQTVDYQDTEHQAVPAAGIAEDSLLRPEAGWQLGAVLTQAGTGLADVFGQAITAEGQRAARGCAGPSIEWEGGWLSCWASSRWWMGQAYNGAALLVAATAADADPRMQGMPSVCQ